MEYTKLEKLSIKTHPEINEAWVQEKIVEDPSLLDLGEVIVKDRERQQPRAGRLDLLLQDVESAQRYEVEIQLGKTDESHIIRTIEYWDIERKRYPQYDHCAVIIAEDITSRFLNVISLFNGMIPLIAIKMNAVQIGNQISLMFITVLDQVELGLVDEDEEVSEVTDRAYWEKRGTKATAKIADDLIELIHEIDPDMDLKYNKFYIGLATDGRTKNIASFRPKKKFLRLDIKIKRDPEVDQKLEDADLDLLDYDSLHRIYKIRLKSADVKKHAELLKELFRKANSEFGT